MLYCFFVNWEVKKNTYQFIYNNSHLRFCETVPFNTFEIMYGTINISDERNSLWLIVRIPHNYVVQIQLLALYASYVQ